MQLRASGGAPWWKGFGRFALQALATVLLGTPALFHTRAALAARRAGGFLAAVEEAGLHDTVLALGKAASVLELAEDDLTRGIKEGSVQIAPLLLCSDAAAEVGVSGPCASLEWAVLCGVRMPLRLFIGMTSLSCPDSDSPICHCQRSGRTIKHAKRLVQLGSV